MTERLGLDLTEIAGDLAHPDPRHVERAVERLQGQLARLRGAGYRLAVEGLASLFYIDTADRPDLETAIERATTLLAAQGERVVPILLSLMDGSDIKSHIYLARTLGRIGCVALPRLRDLLATAEDPYARTFCLYAIGKMTCPEVTDALPEVIGGLMHPDREVRDTAARTLGKIAAAAPPHRLTARMRREMFEALLRSTRDHQPAVRAKAMRSLGKMARASLLDHEQAVTLRSLASGALGESGEYSWDNAFIVRREAREALDAIDGDTGSPPLPSGSPRRTVREL